jgi:exopolysaccharide production protein ExoZ
MTPHSNVIPGLRALRGLAALLVFFQHIFWQASVVSPGLEQTLYRLNFGGIGVLIFFGLSAFLISGKAGDPPLRFVVDRLRRLVPGFWLALLLAATLDYMRLGTNGLTWQLFFFLPVGPLPGVTVPYWTLYYEALLYAVIFCVARLSHRWVGASLVLWALIAWIWQDRPYGNGHYLFPTWYHMVFPVFAAFFAAGIWAAWRSKRPVSERTRGPLAALYGVVAVACFQYPILVLLPIAHKVLYEWPAAVLPAAALQDLGMFYFVLGVACALRAAFLWQASGPIGRMLGRLGDYSYGIYLMHIAIIWVGIWLLQQVGLRPGYGVAAVLLTVFGLPLSVLCGWGEYRLQLKIKAWLDRRRQSARSQHHAQAVEPGGTVIAP